LILRPAQMRILSHRGYWKTPAEKNSRAAFDRSFTLGFGTETDFRDYCGELVIAHDPPLAKPGVTAAQFFAMMASDPTLSVAINIKADGLQRMLKEALDTHGIRDYFLFDMSIPDALLSVKAGLRIFTRQSDVEVEPQLYAQAEGVWVDAFYDDSWITADAAHRHLDAGKAVCLVSPELHRRDHRAFWERFSTDSLINHPSFMICTDIPEEARNFFSHG
jgi:hypothetical protein